ncbi:hypothetical protein HanRHA438_Chr03g0108181 [Helianthus annuus]|nr:hypothetical protein HanRHA438_Chr03g0108181 [Helianthus annuus]
MHMPLTCQRSCTCKSHAYSTIFFKLFVTFHMHIPPSFLNSCNFSIRDYSLKKLHHKIECFIIFPMSILLLYF